MFDITIPRLNGQPGGVQTNYVSGDRQTISVTDIISEGPIQGLVEGGKSVLVNNDPLMASERTVYSTPAGGKASLTSGSTTVTIEKGLAGSFAVSNPSQGKRFLLVHGAYTLKATTSGIDPITQPGITDSEVETKNIPLGGSIAFTRVSGDACDDAWNASSDEQAQIESLVRNLSDGSAQAVVRWASGRAVRGVVTGMVDGQNTFTFTYKAPFPSNFIATTNDLNGSTQHTISIDLFLEIASISGTTITLSNAAPTTISTSCSITAPTIPDSGLETNSTTALIADEKYPGSSFQFRPGTVDQEPITTLEGIGSSSVTMLTSALAMEKDQAQTITYSQTASAEIDFIKLFFSYPSGLYVVNEENGKKWNGAAAYKIEFCGVRPGRADKYIVIDGGGNANGTPCFVHQGKYPTGVVFESNFDVEPYKPFTAIKIRITRLTNHQYDDPVPLIPFTGVNNDKSKLKGIYTSSVTSAIGIVKERLHYPYTSYANVTFSSKSFSSLPKRTYDVQGLKVAVPSNYTTREENNSNQATYSGFWDGSFKDDKVYTDNPAWVFYDILVNDRYGLGDFLRSTDIDQFSLYKISKYCDELVPDGKGGTEPRFRANLYLTKATDAYKVLKDMATIFRGMLYWQDSKITTVQDGPSEPIYNFSRANVVDGQFNYETTGDKTRVNQIIVSWNNPINDYRLEPIIVEDKENQIKTGKVRAIAAVAFGCTSEGQAIRYGRWKLWTSINQTEIVNFQTSVNAGFLAPGDIVNIQDEADYTIPFSGRVNTCTNSAITIDRDLSSNFVSGYTYDISVILPKRAAILNQASATVGGASLSRGDEVTTARIASDGDQTTLIVTNDETTKKNIVSALDDSNNALNLQYAESTVVEERRLTTASTTTSDGKNTIPISSAFSETPAAGAIWAIKQTATGTTQTTASSYKQYKIMAIAESEEQKYDIVAAEYYVGKFDDIEQEFALATQDPLFPPEGVEDVPKPRNLRILRAPNPDTPGEELIVRWDPPEPAGSANISTTYENFNGYIITHSFDGLDGTVREEPKTVTSLRFNGVENGIHTVYVRTVSAKGRVSAAAFANIEVDDIFDGDHPRIQGLSKGGYSSTNAEMTNEGSNKGLFRFDQESYAAAPFQRIEEAKRNTSADADSYSISCTALANSNWPTQTGTVDTGYVMMDFSALDASSPNANALKLVTFIQDTTLDIGYWVDGAKYAASANNVWTNITTSATMTKGSRKVTGTGFNNLAVPDAIKVGASFGAKVAYIDSSSVLYLDRPWEASTAANQTLQKQELDIDFSRDFLVSPVAYDASGTDGDGSSGSYQLGGEKGVMTFLQVQEELSKVGRSIVAVPSLQAINYQADDTQTTSYNGITIEMTAVGFQEAEFKVTGAGFSQTNVSAESGFTAGTNNKRTFTVHTGTSNIAYSAVPLNFTIEAREKAFPDNTNKQTSVTVSISKIREGQQGKSAALVYLYKNSASVPDAPDSSFPDVTVSMETGKITGGGSFSGSSNLIADGWYAVPQAVTGTDKQWIVAATASSAGTTDTIGDEEWSDPPTQFSGADGATGSKGAIVELYQRTNSGTAPNDPSGPLTYTFNTGVISEGSGQSGNFNSWQRQAQSPIESSKYLWKITAAAISTEDTDLINQGDWSDAIIAAQWIKGDRGEDADPAEDGKRSVQGYLYYESTGSGSPTAPGEKTYYFATGDIYGPATSGNNSVRSLAQGHATNAWTNEPGTQDPTSSNTHWTIRYSGTEAAPDSSTLEVTYSSIVQYTNFTGVVTFSEGTQGGDDAFYSGTTKITTIDGGTITTGAIASPTFLNNQGGTKLSLDLPSGANDNIFEVRNSSNNPVFSITKAGNITGKNFSMESGTIDSSITIAAISNVENKNPQDQLKSAFSASTTIEAGSIALETTASGITSDSDNRIEINATNNQILIKDDGNTRVKIGLLTV